MQTKFNVELVGYAASFWLSSRHIQKMATLCLAESNLAWVGIDPNVALARARARHFVRSNLPTSVFRC